MKPNFVHFVAVLSLNAALAQLGGLMVPIAVGALAESGVNAGTLGLIAFLELGGLAATAVISSTRMGKLDPLMLCLAGSAMCVVGNLVSGFLMHSMPVLLAMRPLVGIGSGLMTAGGLAIVARTQNPERLYGYIGMSPCITALIGFALAPHLIRMTGDASGIFTFQGIVAVVNTISLYTQRSRVNAFIAADTGHKLSEAAEVAAEIPAKERLDVPTWVLAVGSSFFMSFGDSSVWAFVAPLGGLSNISLDGMSTVLTVSAILGTAGPLLAGRIGNKYGLMLPVLIGQGAMMVLSLLMVHPLHPWLYASALYARVFSILFLGPIYNGLYARVDPVGRLVAAAAGFLAVGYALGPLVGGQLISIEQKYYLPLGFLSASATAVSVIMTLMLMHRRKQVLANHNNSEATSLAQ